MADHTQADNRSSYLSTGGDWGEILAWLIVAPVLDSLRYVPNADDQLHWIYFTFTKTLIKNYEINKITKKTTA